MTEFLDRIQLIAFLNELLEAERAGSRVTLRTSQQVMPFNIQKIATAIHHDEARWCEMLVEMIKGLGGEPSAKTGSFYEKAMTIYDLHARFSFLNKGQAWVVTKLSETIPRIADEAMQGQLANMLVSHKDNIAKVLELEWAD